MYVNTKFFYGQGSIQLPIGNYFLQDRIFQRAVFRPAALTSPRIYQKCKSPASSQNLIPAIFFNKFSWQVPYAFKFAPIGKTTLTPILMFPDTDINLCRIPEYFLSRWLWWRWESGNCPKNDSVYIVWFSMNFGTFMGSKVSYTLSTYRFSDSCRTYESKNREQ